MTGIAPRRAHGLYGAEGWLESTGVLGLLAPLVCPGRGSDDYLRFEGLGPLEAAALLEALPAGALADRQNLAPDLDFLLRTTIDRPGVRLSGYLITAPRPDERLSVDGLFACDPDGDSEPGAYSAPGCAQWAQACALLGWDPAAFSPDEFWRLGSPGSMGAGWWLWWD
ncbi:hypothetical protein M3T53_04290 [Actinomyces sp. B33]|uniref:hypothetical protein n=1 Tax=Actinomyces sp. B33 TaxID=2942131 RepID=UPI00233FA788|nr:hypothetical protein [Actinomyces sp. B33]MDC4232930.1 hypothetical protein [Actinomyces sp. B33]